MEEELESRLTFSDRLAGVVASASIFSIILNVCIVMMLVVESLTRSGDKYVSIIYQGEGLLAAVAILALFLGLLPLAAFRKTRFAACTGLYLISFVFQWLLWVRAVVILYVLWGLAGLIGGAVLSCFFFLGLPGAALLMTILNGQWSGMWSLVFLAGLAYGPRALALYLGNKLDQQQAASADLFRGQTT